MMTTTQHRWQVLYPEHVSSELSAAARTLDAAWDSRVAMDPQQAAISHVDLRLTAEESDVLSDALASEFQSRGVGEGDQVGIRLQNIPQFPLTMLALWKIGATALVLNPMYQQRELEHILADASPAGVLALEEDLPAVREASPAEIWTIGTHEGDLCDPGHPRPAGSASEFAQILRSRRGDRPRRAVTRPETAALLTYTSGTTGPPKGAVGTHRNLLAVAEGNQQWYGFLPGDLVLAVAPLFHITGAVAAATASLLAPVELVFIGRVRADAMHRTIRDRGIHHILGSITVYNALLDLPEGDHDAADFSTLRTVYSGGAPVPPATVDRFEKRFGHYIHNIYGMTETASAVVAVPLGTRAPIHEASGTLSIGVPLPGLDVRVTDFDGAPLPFGEQGELELRGPQVTPGYLNNPDATQQTLADGWLRTGDIALIDDAGWIYLVDRKKDQINVSGYKVWPREVEDVLYEHPAVKEAAVVGQPDDYSGERVAAFVSLQQGRGADPEELKAHVRSRVASYKCPKEVTIIDDLPKTATGKIQRRKLRKGQ